MLSMLMCANCLGVTTYPGGEEKVLCRIYGRERSVTCGECFGKCKDQETLKTEDDHDTRRNC